MIEFTIDEVEIRSPEGATILEAADAADVYIPRLCSHPDLPPVDPRELDPWEEIFQGSVSRHHRGSTALTDVPRHSGGYEGCLLCLVTISGRSAPVRACTTRVADGMQVATASAEIASRRRSQLKKLLASHPHACVQCAQRVGCALEPCSTNVAREERCCPIFHHCELRKVAEHIGIPDDTPRYRPANLPIIEDQPLLLWDTNLCIGCLRCVRMCRDVRKVDALGFVLSDDGEPVVGTRAPTLADSGCRFCLSCVEVCPTGALRLKFEDPRLDGERVTRCVAACPAGMDVPRYLREIRRGEFARADAVIREAAPFPRVLGQVCFHPCEEQCLRGTLSEPIAICALKRAAADHAGQAIWKSRLTPASPTGKKVAIIGAGPAGLTAGWFLKLKGHEISLFDSQPSPGGWLRDGIPRYRLSSRALEADIEDIIGLGIHCRMGVDVGRDISFAEVREGHDAVFIAIGARGGKRLHCEGADLPGVESGLGLLKRIAATGRTDDATFGGDKIVVIGGGNVAIDVARTALRLGPEEVHLFCLEERPEMPAYRSEVAQAEHEGVVLHPGWGPSRIVGADKVEQVEFRKCTAVFDHTGKFAPEFDESSGVSQEADRVLVAIGQEPAVEHLASIEGITHTRGGYLRVDMDSMATSLAGVYAGGEIVSGPSSVVEAIGHGRRAASAIDRWLGGDGNIHFRWMEETDAESELGRVDRFSELPRVPVPRSSPDEAVQGFSPVERGYAPTDAVREAGRCLGCDLRLLLHPAPTPSQLWLELTAETLAEVPESEGVYQLLDENREVYAIKGVADLRRALTEIATTSTRAKFFQFDEDPMYSKRESELLQQYLQQHGCMPPGEAEDDLDDLF
ncbi:MAG: FAD-dependent oxidoreductase [Gemmatimonadales bacterium]|nr:FAD-dependent oxidoreductase [Gemmatimonadales bacterium]NIN10179.1 FAD-dependent oxidoreductase [Gemmatimonadales bacterium]NIN48924.1 FAD-dependent oxidoreductase [Gemmatimonadales bacterium]NIP06388.1 FAD-dependent oxidoreductase [Gemmatimonadales bacterium]NIR01434.1 FAD-dependent oxidoreductase [Gemmatimonadales bacterium]